MNQILDDALGAFIDVLDQHTLADMVRAAPRSGPPRASAEFRRHAGCRHARGRAIVARCRRAIEAFTGRPGSPGVLSRSKVDFEAF